ncbi:hypothetical protein ACPCUK_27620 [Streptomyces arboris]|uniref:hypothetical protein n=1 Tax=Streptomyces arboris TaxID=2600619 RepID=UPI003C2D2FCD
MSTRDENMVAALRRERAAYVAKGKDDRVAQVDDQLSRLGYTPEDQETGGPKGRTSQDPTQQTADQTTGPNAAADSGDTTPPDSPPATEAGDGTAAAPPAEEKPPAKKTAAARRSTAKE